MKKSRQGLQWDFGGWFGSLLGSTLWMLLLALTILVQAPLAAALVLVLYASVNAIGIALWNRRERIRIHPALQTLVWVSGCASVGALFSVGTLANLPEFGVSPVHTATKWSLIVLGITIFLSALFRWKAGPMTEERTASS